MFGKYDLFVRLLNLKIKHTRFITSYTFFLYMLLLYHFKCQIKLKPETLYSNVAAENTCKIKVAIKVFTHGEMDIVHSMYLMEQSELVLGQSNRSSQLKTWLYM